MSLSEIVEAMFSPKEVFESYKMENNTGEKAVFFWVAVISAENHKRQRRKRQSVTAK